MSFRRAVLAIALVAPLVQAAAAAPIILRVQKNASTQPVGASYSPTLSGDGSVVVFRTDATNIVDIAASNPLLLYHVGSRQFDLLTPTNTNGGSYSPALSTSGRYVAFETLATNIPSDGSNGENTDVLRLDRQTNSFQHASRAFGDSAGTPIKTNAAAKGPAISGDGRYVLFTSVATNLLNGAPTGGFSHLYQMDFASGTVSMIDMTAQAAYGSGDVAVLEAGAISADGNRVVFTTKAKNLTAVFAGNVADVLVGTRNLQTGAFSFQNVNRNTAGTVVGDRTSERGSISANGRYVVFRTAASNIHTNDSQSDLYVRDLNANTLHTVALPTGYQSCDRARVADNGDVLMQCSPMLPATNIQLFVASLGGTTPRLVSRSTGGVAANGSSNAYFTTSADGSLIAFESTASNLITNDTNGTSDVFLSGEAGVLDGFFENGFE